MGVKCELLAVGGVVPWGRAGVGAIATQSRAKTTYGPRGLELLASGLSASKTIEQLTRDDDRRAQRQGGIVGIEGPPATFTGDECYPWAGGHIGEHYTCHGDNLVGEESVLGISPTFQVTQG